jgi:hypothetical protein
MVQELVTVTWRIRSRNPTKSGVQHFKQVTTEPRRELRNHCHILILESILLVLEQLLPAICVSQSTCLTKLIFLQIYYFDRFAKSSILGDHVCSEVPLENVEPYERTPHKRKLSMWCGLLVGSVQWTYFGVGMSNHRSRLTPGS